MNTKSIDELLAERGWSLGRLHRALWVAGYAPEIPIYAEKRPGGGGVEDLRHLQCRVICTGLDHLLTELETRGRSPREPTP